MIQLELPLEINFKVGDYVKVVSKYGHYQNSPVLKEGYGWVNYIHEYVEGIDPENIVYVVWHEKECNGGDFFIKEDLRRA